MTKMQKVKSVLSSATTMAMNQIRKDLDRDMHPDELEAMGKGNEEGGEEHEQE